LTGKRTDSNRPEASSGIPPATLRAMHQTMLRIRVFEERIAELITQGEIVCPVHLYIGEEAVAAGVAANLNAGDFVFSTHRSHGHYLAKGGDLKALAAELYGKETGCCGGRGGSMHLASPEVGLPGSSAIVAGTIPLAAGAALSFATRKTGNVAVAFFGDGAAGEGVFYESLNFAALKKLPVIFVCENNLYSTHLPIADCLAETEIYKKAVASGMPGTRVDGNDVVAVYRAAEKAVNGARKGGGPALLECMTYRWRGHVGPNFDVDKGFRTQAELDAWMGRCSIKHAEKLLADSGIISEADKKQLYQSVEEEVAEAIAFAKESPYPEAGELLRDVFKV